MIKSILANVAAGAAFLLLSTVGASAVTLNFNTYHSGADLGSTSLGTLEATQMGSDTLFTYTNLLGSPHNSFTTQLFMTYDGSLLGSSLANVAGVAASSYAFGSFVNAGLTWNAGVGWPATNAGGGILRLNFGESSTFKLLNTSLDSFFVGDYRAMIHMQGLSDGQSTKYVAPVPLPGAILLLLGALGGLGLIARKRQAA